MIMTMIFMIIIYQITIKKNRNDKNKILSFLLLSYKEGSAWTIIKDFFINLDNAIISYSIENVKQKI